MVIVRKSENYDGSILGKIVLYTIGGEDHCLCGLMYIRHVVTQSLIVYSIWGFILVGGFHYLLCPSVGIFGFIIGNFVRVRQRG